MGWLTFIGALVSNSPQVLLAVAPRQRRDEDSTTSKGRESLHFYLQTGSDYAIVFAGVSLLLLVSVLGYDIRFVIEATILFSTALLSYVGISLVNNEVRHDIILAGLILASLCSEQTHDTRKSSSRSTIASPIITYMFTISGLRRSGLLIIWLISETIRFTVTAANNAWRNMVSGLLVDLVLLSLGICVYFYIYFVGVEILRLRYRPRLALQDVPNLQEWELMVFKSIRLHLQEMPHFTPEDHVHILLQLPIAAENPMERAPTMPEGARPPPDIMRASAPPQSALQHRSPPPAEYIRTAPRQRTVTFNTPQPVHFSLDRTHPDSPAQPLVRHEDILQSRSTLVETQRRRYMQGAQRLAKSAFASSLMGGTGRAERDRQGTNVIGCRHSAITDEIMPAEKTYTCCGMSRPRGRSAITAGAIPLYIIRHRNPLQRLLPFLLDVSTEAVVQEAVWKGSSPQLPCTLLGRFRDTTVERWYLAWRCSTVTRWSFVSMKWLIIGQVVVTITLLASAGGYQWTAGSRTYATVSDSSVRIYWGLWTTRVALHGIFTTLYFYDRVRAKSRTWFEWTTISYSHLIRTRLYALFLVLGGIADFLLTAYTNRPLAQEFEMRALSFMLQLAILPFYLHWSRGMNTIFLGSMFSLFLILHRAWPTRAPLTLLKIFPLAATCIYQHFFIARPLDLNYRRMFTTYPLPYLLYLEGLRPHEPDLEDVASPVSTPESLQHVEDNASDGVLQGAYVDPDLD